MFICRSNVLSSQLIESLRYSINDIQFNGNWILAFSSVIQLFGWIAQIAVTDTRLYMCVLRIYFEIKTVFVKSLRKHANKAHLPIINRHGRNIRGLNCGINLRLTTGRINSKCPKRKRNMYKETMINLFD